MPIPYPLQLKDCFIWFSAEAVIIFILGKLNFPLLAQLLCKTTINLKEVKQIAVYNQIVFAGVFFFQAFQESFKLIIKEKVFFAGITFCLFIEAGREVKVADDNQGIFFFAHIASSITN